MNIKMKKEAAEYKGKKFTKEEVNDTYTRKAFMLLRTNPRRRDR